MGFVLEKEAQENVQAPYLYLSKQEVINELKKGTHILGTPGASLTWGIDGDDAKPQLAFGIEGEKQTAAILAEMAEKTPGMFVFHSLSWPESNGDTDHIVVYKDLVIVIDSKRWKSTRKYGVTAKGEILRGTVAFDEGKVKIGYALKQWRDKLPGKPTVRGIVCIAQEKVFVTRDPNWYKAPFRLVEAEKLEDQLTTMFQKHKPKTNSIPASLLIYLGQTLVKARNKREELIRQHIN